MKAMKSLLLVFITFLFLNCQKEVSSKEIVQAEKLENTQIIENPDDFYQKLSNAALSIIDLEVIYTPEYVGINYPNGDVPPKTGVCTDVVIRAYRNLSIDLQKEVHEDMKANFSSYPKIWGLKTTDKNIDHRRVPNLEVFFARKGEKLPVSKNPNEYKIGDLVTWMIADKLPHIGIVTNKKSADGQRNLIVHNVGGGQVLEDCLFSWKIVGHFRYGE